VEYHIDKLNFNDKYVLQRKTLDEYIIEMAQKSKEAVQGRFTVPLGLEIVTYNYGVIVVRDIALQPNIDINDIPARDRYLKLATDLLGYSIELNAGLLEHFHDIVNHPPYVRRIEVFQEPQTDKEPGNYEREWIDVLEKGEKEIKQVVERRSKSGEKNDVSFLNNVEAAIKIEFGPDNERMKQDSVAVLVGGKPVSGKFIEPLIWEGKFTPRLDEGKERAEYTIEIDARDIHNHYPREELPEKNYQLDTDPETVAKVSVTMPPYTWLGYEPGIDRRHSIIVYEPEKIKGGARVVKIEGYAEDYSDGSIGFWNASYPHPSFDDKEGRKGLPNGAWDGSYYFKGDELYLVIDNLYAEYPPSHTLGIGYTVALEGGTFEDGKRTKNLILYTYSGTPAKKRIVKGFKIGYKYNEGRVKK